MTSAGTISIESWAGIVGRWRFTGGVPVYEGSGDGATGFPYGLAIGSVRFRDGRILATMRRETKAAGAGVVLGYHSTREPYVVAQLGSRERAYGVHLFRPEFGWTPHIELGLAENLDTGRDYDVVVDVRGQHLRMTVDAVEVLDTVLPQPLSGTGLGVFAWGEGPVHFTKIGVDASLPRAFVAMPFRDPFNALYEEVIKPEAEDLGFAIVRVDEIHSPGLILDDIRREIEASQVIVAEISQPNPNVFYELGYAHALRKPAVLLARRTNGEQLPFDIRGYRTILYDDTIVGKKKVQENLKKHLDAILAGG